MREPELGYWLCSAGDLVAVTVAVELPGSEWCGVLRGSLIGPGTGTDRLDRPSV